MDLEHLKTEYEKIERKIYPIIDLLDKKNDTGNYLGKYKGITTIKSPLILKTKVLFIGINEGPGRFNELNNNKSANKIIYPKRMLGENHDQSCFFTNNWFQSNNAYGGKDDHGKWIKYEWFETGKQINNQFTVNTINLLYKMAELLFPEEHKTSPIIKNQMPFWYDDINKSIMVTNLYPISTINTKDLLNIFSSLANEPELESFWRDEFPNKKRFNNWDVRLYFIRRVNELISLVEPIVIVCMGQSAFADFTYGQYKSKDKIFECSHKISNKTYPVIGFTRRGNWSKLMTELAKRIVSHI